MLTLCKTALLISGNKDFAERYTSLAQAVEVSLTVETNWNVNYRVSKEVVILGSKHLPTLNKAYYSCAVVILSADENPQPYIEMGVKHFIFDYLYDNELLFAFYKAQATVVHSQSTDLATILKDSSATRYCFREYDFDFGNNKFVYKGLPIYLADTQKAFLADWLLNGYKDNKKRMVICNLRKKFGADFLKDIDRFGQVKE